LVIRRPKVLRRETDVYFFLATERRRRPDTYVDGTGEIKREE
jgi:hypothetical protein